MKIKSDFVTNSSSTSYIFIFKGKDSNDLYPIMKDNWRSFEISEDSDEEINVYDVIKYMKEEEISYSTIGEKIEELEKQIIENKRWIKNNSDNKYSIEYAEEEIQQMNSLIELLKFKSKKGFNYTIECGFSDEEGNLIGCTMRYSRISIDEPKLRVLVTGNE